MNEIAKAIFGTAKGHVQLVALTVGQRIPFVEQGKVDIVVDAITMTCARRKQVDFSTVYYDANAAGARAVRLAGARASATSPASGSARARGRRRST